MTSIGKHAKIEKNIEFSPIFGPDEPDFAARTAV
jgi:hypothetical protein